MARQIHSHDSLFSNKTPAGLSLTNHHIIPKGQLADQEEDRKVLWTACPDSSKLDRTRDRLVR
jgi:hypothetical protein